MIVLVTGAAGFIGSWLCEALAGRGDQVIGVDDFNDGYDPRVKERNLERLLVDDRFTLIRGSLLEPSVLDDCFARPVDAVVHLAARAGVRPSITDPVLYVRENLLATTLLLERARAQAPLPRFIFASSSSVYGAESAVPFREDTPTAKPVSPYAATKRSGELLAYTHHHLYGLPTTCLRLFTVYGPRQRPEMAIHKFARLMRAGQPIPLFGDGSTARDYTFVHDLVDGVVAAIDRCRGFDVINLGSGQPVTLKTLVDKLGRALDITPAIAWMPEQPGDVPRTYADISHAQARLGYAPKTSIELGLAQFKAWLDDQPPDLAS